MPFAVCRSSGLPAPDPRHLAPDTCNLRSLPVLIGRKVGNAEREWYTYLPGSLLRLGQHAPDGTLIAHLHDFQHSLRATLDAQGRTQPYAYTAFGVPLTVAQHPVFGFAGELHDPLSGLVSLRARWYDPDSGTLLTTDPYHGDWQQPYGHHPYQYAYSNPLRFADPSGMLAISVHGSYGQQDPLLITNNMYSLLDHLAGQELLEGELIKTGPGGPFAGPSEWHRAAEMARKIVATHTTTCGKEPILLYGNSRGGVWVQQVAEYVELEAISAGISPINIIDLVVTIAPVQSPDTVPIGLPYNQKRISVQHHVNLLSEYGWLSRIDPASIRLKHPREDWGNYIVVFLQGGLSAVVNRVLGVDSLQNLTMGEMQINGAVNKVYPRTFHNGMATRTQPVVERVIPEEMYWLAKTNITTTLQSDLYIVSGEIDPNPVWVDVERATRNVIAGSAPGIE